jgi:predicted RNA-binding Zn-ribbon protein involved in translation (DUF1610 family)
MPYNSSEMRPCARDTHCTDRQVIVDGGKRTNQPAWTYRPFCDRDREYLIQAIADLPAKYMHLRTELPRTTGQGQRVSGSRTPPAPLRLDVDALMVDLTHVVNTWAEIVAAVAGLVDACRDLDTACRTLTRWVDALLSLGPWPVVRYLPLHEAAQLPAGTTGHVHANAGYAVANVDLDGAGAGLELLKLHARCRSTLGMTRRRDLLHVPCHQCGRIALYREEKADGLQDEAYCGHCGETYAGASWRLLQRLTYEDEIARQAV